MSTTDSQNSPAAGATDADLRSSLRVDESTLSPQQADALAAYRRLADEADETIAAHPGEETDAAAGIYVDGDGHIATRHRRLRAL